MIEKSLPRPTYKPEQSTNHMPEGARYCDLRVQESVESLQRELAELEAYIACLEYALTVTEMQRNEYKAKACA